MRIQYTPSAYQVQAGCFIMDKLIKKIIEESNRKTINITDVLNSAEERLGTLQFEAEGGYQRFASIIEEFYKEGLISPVKSSGVYRRNPPLALRYKINADTSSKIAPQEEEKLMHELISLHPIMKKEYYLKNIEQYFKDREHILKLHDYFSNSERCKSLKYRYTLNERSFEIFNDEKYLSLYGETLLKKLGIDFDTLNCYKTYEAFFYIDYGIGEKNDCIKNACIKNNNNNNDGNTYNNHNINSEINGIVIDNNNNEYNALIVENKDTFMSIAKLLNRKKGFLIGGKRINLLIYGEGKKIISSFKFMDEIIREKTIDNIYYFGDIDYEGIGIFLALKNNCHLKSDYAMIYNIVPHVALYKQLVDKTESPPTLRSNQEEIPIEDFLDYFDDYYKYKISEILKGRKYIPQEALSFGREG